MEHPICSDDTVEKLEAQLRALTSRPDNRRRWMRQVIERLRVSELALKILLEEEVDAEYRDYVWKRIHRQALEQLTASGKIRSVSGIRK